MKPFELEIGDWFEGSAPEELAATCAELSIFIGGQAVSRISRRASRSSSDRIRLPLYPVAEWAAANWWRLLYETNPLRDGESFRLCHNLKFAGEGYFLPDLLFSPEARVFRLEWAERAVDGGRLAFEKSGRAAVDSGCVRRALGDFIGTVLERLEACSVGGTLLQERWEAVRQSELDRGTRGFCMACAQLGMDPYSAGDEAAGRIQAAGRIVGGIAPADEFFNAASPGHPEENAMWLDEKRREASGKISGSPLSGVLAEMKGRFRPAVSHLPWEQGYEEARRVRAEYLRTPGALSDFRARMAEETEGAAIPDSFCSAVVGVGRRGQPVWTASPLSGAFMQGRMLCEYLHTPAGRLGLVTRLATAHQKRNRAFSAELSAPSEELRAELKGRTSVCEDDILELAERFHAGEFVVRYQILNHGLADITPCQNVC